MKSLKIYSHPHDKTKNNSDTEIIRSVRSFLGDENAPIIVSRDEYGKPHILGTDGVYVSVSHSDGLCLVAVARYEIGIDLEKKDRPVKNPLSLAKRYFCEDEIAFLGDTPTEAAFTDMWVAKEALSKLIGEGVPCMRKQSVFSQGVEIVSCDDYDDYIVKIARYI